MNKTFIIIFCLSICMFLSCKKESTIIEPTQLVKISFDNKISDQSLKVQLLVDNEVVAGDGDNIFSGVSKLLTGGEHIIQLKDKGNNEILVDTVLNVKNYDKNSFIFFRTSPDEDVLLLNLNTEGIEPPPPGYIKVNFANFTTHLAGIPLEFVIQKYNDLGGLDTVAILEDPGNKFSDYMLLKVDTADAQGGPIPVVGYLVTLRDVVSKQDVYAMTDPLTGLPIDYTGYFNLDLGASELSARQIFSFYIYTYREEFDPTIVYTQTNHF